jgi:hypothetical protein
MVRRVPPHRRASRDTSFWTGCSGISRSACIRNGIIKSATVPCATRSSHSSLQVESLTNRWTQSPHAIMFDKVLTV